jgi:hypothetical protein
MATLPEGASDELSFSSYQHFWSDGLAQSHILGQTSREPGLEERVGYSLLTA